MFQALALRQSKSIHSDKGLTLETSAFNLFTVANLPYQLQLINPKFCVSKKTVVSWLLTIVGNYLSYL